MFQIRKLGQIDFSAALQLQEQVCASLRRRRTLKKEDEKEKKDFITIDPYDTLGDLVSRVAKSRRNLFPVVDSKGTDFAGTPTRSQVSVDDRGTPAHRVARARLAASERK